MLLKSGFIKERTIYCRHSANSCYCNALKGFGYYFGYTIAIKLLLVLLHSLYTKDLRMLLILKKIFNMQTLNVSFIIASLAAAYKISLCTLRSIRNADSKYDNVVARLLAVHAFVFNRSIIGKYKQLLFVNLGMIKKMCKMVKIFAKKRLMKIEHISFNGLSELRMPQL